MPIFALIDGNSFYASCQIAFEPALRHRPVVVLSNNDGCIVAANAIAKSLNQELMAKVKNLGQGGYRSANPTNMMFQPYFKVKWLLDKHRAAVFSSNYELYADMSSRMHSIIGEFAPNQEVYSIDESFIDLTGLSHLNLTHYGQEIKQSVLRSLGLPVAVGIGPSKTLAKLANHLAKKHAGYDGVLDLTALPESVVDSLLGHVDVGDIWGIGRRLSSRLNAEGIQSAFDLKHANTKRIRKTYGVVVERTVQELNGISCLSLEEVYADKKQIISSRSFGKPVADYLQLEQAVISYVSRAAEKLRRQKGVCSMVSVHITTNRFKPGHYTNTRTIPLIYPSDNSILLAKHARRALKSIWVPGLAYHKAGVVLSEIMPKGPLQEDIFAPGPTFSGNPKQDRLMSVLDQVNQKEGRGSLFLASTGIPKKNTWSMQRNLMSPRYTTRWDEMLRVGG
ncbi:MAG: Y-family DNA polymerase [Pedobacter sp.]